MRWAALAVDASNRAVQMRQEMAQTCAAQPDMVMT
jgi:hypothetical protein